MEKTNSNCIWNYIQGPSTHISAYKQEDGSIIVSTTSFWLTEDIEMSPSEFKEYRRKKE